MSAHPTSFKRCSKCCAIKPLEAFGIESRRFDGRRCFCKECGNAERRKYTKTDTFRQRYRSERHKQWCRDFDRKRRYGLTPAAFQALLDSQDGRCGVCRTDTPGGRWDAFHVDHDHETGKVRGLLCDACNRALGLAGDSLEGVLRFVEYLRRE